MARWMLRVILPFALLALALSIASAAQEPQQQPQQQQPQVKIEWQRGPGVGHLGDIADIKIPEGYAFADKEGAVKLMQLTHNIPSGHELGVLVSGAKGASWFMIFEFDDTGYVKDDDKDKIDAGAILKNIQEGTDEANEERRKHGWKPLHVTGWEKSPFYDPLTHNLTWALRVKSEEPNDLGDVNHRIRLLGRHGTMNVDLVVSPEEYAAGTTEFNSLISGFSYVQGNRYSDFRAGDKVAKYGLAALIAGGAGAVLLKTGLLTKLLKPILVGLVALGAFLKKIFSSIFGSKESKVEDPNKQAAAQG